MFNPSVKSLLSNTSLTAKRGRCLVPGEPDFTQTFHLSFVSDSSVVSLVFEVVVLTYKSTPATRSSVIATGQCHRNREGEGTVCAKPAAPTEKEGCKSCF